MIPPPGTPANKQLRQIAQWGTATRVLNQLQARLTDYGVPSTFTREDGQPRLEIDDELTVWAAYNGEVIYWAAKLGDPAQGDSSTDLAQVARLITERVRAAPAAC
ncbi:hypothetical protein ACWEU6_12790 [Streptosporangium sandarakinum]